MMPASFLLAFFVSVAPLLVYVETKVKQYLVCHDS